MAVFKHKNRMDLSVFGGSGFGLHGNQVLHTQPDNRVKSKEMAAFVKKVFQGAAPLDSDAAVLRFASDQVTVEGLFVELGTGAGRTTNFLAALNPHKTIYTFDSYLGLPLDWDRGNVLVPGILFAWEEGKPLPAFLLNVELQKGWFSATLPRFMEAQDEPIAFLHIDCDIYESTAEAFEILGPKIVPGTVILFDEFYNYPNFRHHELKAFEEFLEKFSLRAKYVAYNRNHEQVAAVIWERRLSSDCSKPNA